MNKSVSRTDVLFMFSRACSCQCTPACMVPTAAVTHSAAPGPSIHVTPSLLGAPRKQYWTFWGICLCALPMLQILKWHKPPLSCRRGQRQRRTKPDAFFISFFFFSSQQCAYHFLLKTTKFSSKTHLVCVCGVGGVDVPCLLLSLTPTLAPKIASHQMSLQKCEPCCICWCLRDVFLQCCCSSWKNTFQSQMLFSRTDK